MQTTTTDKMRKIDFRAMLERLGFDVGPESSRKPGEILRLPKFLDTHGHARNPPSEEPQFRGPGGESRMKTAIATTAPFCQTQIWMPNLGPNPIDTAARLREYHEALLSTEAVCLRQTKRRMQQHIALRLGKHSTPEILLEAADAMDELGMIRVAKIYPDGVTTNSAGGWKDLSVLYPAIEAAAELGFIICLHGEQPGPMIDTLERERQFLDKSFDPLFQRFPQVKFHLEHITTREAVDMVKSLPDNIGAGITKQHLDFTTNDLLEWIQTEGAHPGLNPHHHCRPPAQKFRDQKALLLVALNADNGVNRKFCFGSDSAPHMVNTKLTACGCAGVMSSPTSASSMVALFDAAGRLGSPTFDAFVYDNAARYFSLTPDTENVFELEYRPWIVPASYGGIAPMYAGCELPWAPVAWLILNPEM